MAPGLGPHKWNRRVSQQRLGYSSLELLTGPAAASGPKRVFSSVEWAMKLISPPKKTVPKRHFALQSGLVQLCIAANSSDVLAESAMKHKKFPKMSHRASTQLLT
jgi:hypothetical protein